MSFEKSKMLDWPEKAIGNNVKKSLSHIWLRTILFVMMRSGLAERI